MSNPVFQNTANKRQGARFMKAPEKRGDEKDSAYKIKKRLSAPDVCKWWPERESNPRHRDFQSLALPTELSGQNCHQAEPSEPQMILADGLFSKPRIAKFQINLYLKAYW
jgi:hypothetical protein